MADLHFLLRPLFVAGFVTAATVLPAQAATTVEEVTSPGGIKAYLATAPAIPFLSMSFQFTGGAALDPDGKEGLAIMTSSLLDEGAGEFDSQAFRAELEDNAIRLSFSADRDAFSGTLRTLTEHRDHAFDLLRLALSEPRFDDEPVERVRQQLLVGLRQRSTEPDYLAARQWFSAAFPDHPYGRPTRGTIESVGSITVDDMRFFRETRLALDNLVIGVAGDITAEELGPLLDKAFGILPAESQAPQIEDTTPQITSETLVDTMDIPQSVAIFGRSGIAREDPDYYIALVANYILGGGGFSSRLMQEVREKRGLAYGVSSSLYDTDHSPLWLGSVATRNDQVAQSLAIIREEAARMAAGEVSEQELGDAKTYLTGSFPLRLTSNDGIARVLVGMQIYNLGIDYLDRRNSYIEAVTLDELKRVAARFLEGDLLVSIVGQPTGLDG